MKKLGELVFIPGPVMGHLASTVEVAKLMVKCDDRISVTFLIMKLFDDPNLIQYTNSLASTPRIRFVNLPDVKRDPNIPRTKLLTTLIEAHKPHVREAVSDLIVNNNNNESDSPRLAGFVLDMVCTAMKDVANEFGVPSYVYFTSGAAFLGLMSYLLALHDEQGVDPTEFKGSDGAELAFPSFVNPLPAKVLPMVVLDKYYLPFFLDYARGLRGTKGIVVNTFLELEPYAVESLSKDARLPPVYPVGPIVNLGGVGHGPGPEEGESRRGEIMEWLDDQPPSSVVFLCFGSMGSFGADQVAEIARALEHGGRRFVWSLRRPPPRSENKLELPSDYADIEDALPEGFLGRTAGVGRVIGWAPQAAILAHPAVGAFVSHCGWNSILESLWFGVPVAAWPLYAEQQFNAFELVVECGLSAEIRMDYMKDVLGGGTEMVVSAEEIERGIGCLMGERVDSEIRKKVKEMSEASRKALAEGGSSFSSLRPLIADVLDTI